MSNTQPQALPQGIGVPSSGDGHAATVYEETHVHGVYEAIAPHFSATRHKPWPFVSSFLASQTAGSVGLDVGCGNGKNMGVNQDVVMLGCDRSAALVALARDMWCAGRASHNDGHGAIAGADVAVADGLHLPFREASADFVICIAVIHHLSTRERRVDAIRRLLWCLRRNRNHNAHRRSSIEADSPHDTEKLGGGVLVYVWALEQSSSRRGWDKDSEQDLLVPWVMKAPQQKKLKASQPSKPRKKKQELPATAARQVYASPCRDRNGAGEGRNPSSGEGGEYMQGRRQQSHGTHDEEGRTAAAADADADPHAAMSQS
ncbi:tRNA methyltransferase, has a role in tRNA modification, partial [Gnomoniopsis sp. IMI 355080]